MSPSTSKHTLAIETSTELGSVAFFNEAGEIWREEIPSGRNHNTEVLQMLRERFDGSTVAPDEILVGAGPGNYTGVRVAISIAHGFQLVWGADVVLLPSFLSAIESEGALPIFGNARRGEFYQTSFDGQMKMLPIDILGEAEALAYLEKQQERGVLVFEQRPSFVEFCERLQVPYVFSQPVADQLILAWKKMPEVTKNHYRDQSQEPIYLRPPSMEKSTKNHPLLSI